MHQTLKGLPRSVGRREHSTLEVGEKFIELRSALELGSLTFVRVDGGRGEHPTRPEWEIEPLRLRSQAVL
jgi:hypothetical protein